MLKPGETLPRGWWYVNFTPGETSLENVANERQMLGDYMRNGAAVGNWRVHRTQGSEATGNEFWLLEVLVPTPWEWNSKHVSMPEVARKGSETTEADTATTPHIETPWEIADELADEARQSLKGLAGAAKYLPLAIAAGVVVLFAFAWRRSRK